MRTIADVFTFFVFLPIFSKFFLSDADNSNVFRNFARMKIVLVGAGNVATHLGRALMEAGHDILQVYSRTMSSSSQLAAVVGAMPVDNVEDLTASADVYIISVKDSVLAELLPRLCKGREEAVFLHTAGSMPMNVFAGMALHFGVLYPMQTFSKQRQVDFSEVPCFLEANDERASSVVRQLAEGISNHLYDLDSDGRKFLHLSAVWSCNFVNHCYDVAGQVLQRHNIPFSVLLPLIDETARKVHELSPREAQTGPAVRYDENVIRSQAQLLKENPLLKDLYERMSLSIHKMSEQ